MRMKTAHDLGTLTFMALVLCGPCAAQYKVVASDGSVTYTDRPPAHTNVRVTPLQRGAVASAAAAADAGAAALLPLELRAVASRYPVTLYTTGECTPCDSARALLQQRGVPYSERRVLVEEDAVALERLLGWRTVPSLTLGTQALRGFASAEWSSYIDAAGYPRESRLPRGWSAPAATPLTERAPVAAAAPAPARSEVDTGGSLTPSEPTPPGAIRF
jgi:glutaredoxin